MKRIIKSLLLAVLCISFIVVLFGCKPSNIKQPNIDKNVYTVSFMVEGKVYENQLVNGGGAAVKPFKDPTKPIHKFVGWSTDKLEYKPYDFKQKLTSNLTLHAYFVFDEETMKAEIDELSRSIVKVTNTYKENGEEKQREGVGYVYIFNSGYCFVVTNYHTVYANENQTDAKIIVTDKEGNEFDANVFKNKNKEHPALDKEYDLAVVCFPYNGTLLKKNEHTAIIDYMGEDVVSVASKDSVSTGKVTEYKKTTANIDESLSSIDFEVYCHNAIPSTEVKESILYNIKLQLIGLTYYSENGTAYTIPQGRIAMFLNEYLYN